MFLLCLAGASALLIFEWSVVGKIATFRARAPVVRRLSTGRS
jgi:hypothetical protein